MLFGPWPSFLFAQGVPIFGQSRNRLGIHRRIRHLNLKGEAGEFQSYSPLPLLCRRKQEATARSCTRIRLQLYTRGELRPRFMEILCGPFN